MIVERMHYKVSISAAAPSCKEVALDVPCPIATFVRMSTAKIYRPAKTAMQSGKAKTHQWLLEYERPEPGTPDALMGWNTMPDTIAEIKLWFATKEEAIAYATSKKIDYSVSEPHKAVVPPKAYAENFSAYKRKSWDSNC